MFYVLITDSHGLRVPDRSGVSSLVEHGYKPTSLTGLKRDSPRAEMLLVKRNNDNKCVDYQTC